jgi:hypothetical protein
MDVSKVKRARGVAARTEKDWATEIPNKLEKRIDSRTVCRLIRISAADQVFLVDLPLQFVIPKTGSPRVYLRK